MAATVVIVAVLLVVFGDDESRHMPQDGPGERPTTFAETSASRGPPYANCDEAHADGRSNILQGDLAYNPALDRDGDGIACDR
ncbi:calcium-binding protein [Mycobacterium tuberculosis variant microti OV254]|nr:calcium-binding protein [Mycobacterium tuberculosis variant microti OV254]